MSAEGEKGRGEGHVAYPPQHQYPYGTYQGPPSYPPPPVMGFPQPAPPPELTASAQPAPGYYSHGYQPAPDPHNQGPPSYPPPPVMGFPQPAPPPELTASAQPAPGNYSHGYQPAPGHNVNNVTVEVNQRREEHQPCCGIGWLLFILGFFLAIPWYVGAILLCSSRKDDRERPGYIGCTIAAAIFTFVVIIGVTTGA